MLIIGCDYHPGFQQIAYVDSETGEFQERDTVRKIVHAITLHQFGTRVPGDCGKQTFHPLTSGVGRANLNK